MLWNLIGQSRAISSPAGKTQSTVWGMDGMEDEGNADLTILNEVSRTWGQWGIGPDPNLPWEQRRELIREEGVRLTRMVEEAVGLGGTGGLLEQWRRDNPGLVPDYRTVVSLMEQAWDRERSRVLAEELYSQVTDEVYARVHQVHGLVEHVDPRWVE